MSLIVKDLSFSYHQNTPLLKNISFELRQGECLAITGANGVGKTTLTKLLMGLLQADSGSILIDAKNLQQLRLPQRANYLGYVFQNPTKQLFNPTVFEEVGFALKHKGFDETKIKATVNALLEYFDLTPQIKAFPFTLSQGEKQRLALATTLALNPPYLILDEPTTGLDHQRKENLFHYLCKLTQEKKGILMISHDDDFISQLAHRVLMLEGGQLYTAKARCRKEKYLEKVRS